MKVLRELFVFLMFLLTVTSYRILGLFSYPGKSHLDLIIPVMKQLAANGHNITVVSPTSLSTPQERYTDLSFQEAIPLRQEVYTTNEMNCIQSRIWTSYLDLFIKDNLIDAYCKAAYESDALQKLLHSEEDFDLVITEMFNSDCILAVNKKYKAPVIGMATSIMMPWHPARFGVPDNPSYLPTLFLDYSNRMKFFERVENTLVSLTHKFWFIMRQIKDDEIGAKYMNEFIEVASRFANNASLLLVNSHYSLNGPRALTPNVIEIGGAHIGKPKRLPMMQ
ncbi:hypothetical protein HHI36_010521 [Cryptolaemus montrouzieri]|uniref:UDP-glucuronosyltransferase n=1 Tax=Cryptolaemus montrouzieri TaxID=559131 RepID=A0ABD2MJ28_9CUCU